MNEPDFFVAISARIVTDKELTMNAKGVAIGLYDLANFYASNGHEGTPITVEMIQKSFGGTKLEITSGIEELSKAGCIVLDSEKNVIELFTRRTK